MIYDPIRDMTILWPHNGLSQSVRAFSVQLPICQNHRSLLKQCPARLPDQSDPCAAILGPAMVGDSPEKLDDTSHGSPVGLLGFPWVPLFLGDLLWGSRPFFFAAMHPSGDVYAVFLLSLLALPVIPLNYLLVHLDLAPLSLGYVFP